MRGRGILALLVLMLVSGCLAPPESDGSEAPRDPLDAAASDAGDERDARSANGPASTPTPSARPAPPAPPEGPRPVRPAAPVAPEEGVNGTADETLRVSWTPEAPVPGDTLLVTIEAPTRWPEPRCSIHQIAATSAGGGETASFPAELLKDGTYVCERLVLDGVGAIVLAVSRLDDEVIRVSGPHTIPVDVPLMPPRREFESFVMEPDADGNPHFVAELPAMMPNLAYPELGPIPATDSVWAGITVNVETPGLTIGNHAYPEWQSTYKFQATADVRAWIRDMAARSGRDHHDADFIVFAVGHARSDTGFAVSSGWLMGFGACAERECFVQDG